MNTIRGSFLKKALCCILVAILIAVPVSISWAATLTTEELNTWKMWIKLAINGYAAPLKVESRTDNSWMDYLQLAPKRSQ